jgi:hypothetical protein
MGEAEHERAVRSTFAAQASWAAKLGSPFTAALCEAIERNLDRDTPVGRRVLDWPGKPDAQHDAIAVRLCGGLHALVRSGLLPELSQLYPPHPFAGPEKLQKAVRDAFTQAEDDLLRWLDFVPQTNEIARSALLIAGLAQVASETGLPISLFELGSSAGLNLLLDRYDSRTGSRRFGDPGSAVTLAPVWEGGDPPDEPPRIVSRRGVDINPLDVTDPDHRARLLAYVWPDQPERIARLEAALAIAADSPPALDRGSADAWLETVLTSEGNAGTARVVMHSIAFQYFSQEAQARITEHMETVGNTASRDTPLGWLRYELDPSLGGNATLRLRLWPDGSDRLLAETDGHGRKVTWLL